MSKYC